ncbi:hypothetical protein [Algicella marina]|uniref:Uncharacterized protein n=1 Tax=Algicella marina TaxID=2683284 RepID=A0A6P1SVT5_9RHOB|nr:hypothetical protein [Algicella marina]QHQ33867.1 hypothetical protein GO499_01060 [Algicella marina]
MITRFPFVLAIALAGAADAQDSSSPFDLIEFHEEVYPRAKVSTSLVLGVMFGSDDDLSEAPRIRATLPDDWAKPGEMTCIRVTSKDGTYESAAAFRLREEPEAPLASFPHPTDEGPLIAEKALAVRATRGDCAQEDAAFTPVYWNSVADDADTLNIYLNTGGAETVLALGVDADAFAVFCEDVKEENGLKYTALCRVPIDKLPEDDTFTVYLDVTRNRNIEYYEFELSVAGR